MLFATQHNTTQNITIRKGFTLIELSVVMTIMAMLAAALAFRLLGPWTAATIRSDIEKIRASDDFARKTSISESTPHLLIFDIKGNVLRLQQTIESGALRTTSLSKLSRIEKVKFEPGRENAEELSVVVTDQGSSRSYAVQIITEQRARWLLFIGQTGQVFEFDEEKEVDAYFSMLR